MASVWKRLQRVNKRAAKFQYTASYHRIDLETTPKWKPTKLCIVWTRRSRRVVTEPVEWEPSLKDPLKGAVIYPVPVNQTVTVTLFKDSRTNELEDKEWTFVIEDVSTSGKRRRLATASINMRLYASLSAALRPVVLTLCPVSPRVSNATLHLTLHSRFTREGSATDEDMQSLASMLSVNNNSDIAVLEDLDDDDYTLSDNSAKQMSEFRQQLESLTHSLTSEIATPNSVQSLAFDSRGNTQQHDDIEENQDDARTPTGSDLRIFERETDAEEVQRPDYLTNLTEKLTGTGINSAEKPHPFVSSTPTKQTEPKPELTPPEITIPTISTEEPLKTVNLKPRPFEKFNLKPLDLKSNFNSLNVCEAESPKEENGLSDKGLERDKTPVVDLLEWCQSITSEYHSVKVTNLTTSWRSGLAFCAIIHHFRPDLIDFSGLQPDDCEGNLRAAFSASSTLGVSPVLTVNDVLRTPAPDRLAVMTYLFQLRAHFTGGELQVEQLGTSSTECSYLVGRHDTDEELAQQLFSREVSMRRSRNHGKPVKQYSTESRKSIDKSPTAIKDVKDILLQHSKSLLGKVLSPSRDILKPTDKTGTKWFTDPLNATKPNDDPPRPLVLMTRKELTDPFGSDDEETPEKQHNTYNHVSEELTKTPSSPTELKSPPELKPATPITELPKPTQQLMSRHDELKERARLLLEATKREARKEESNRLEESEKDINSDCNKPMSEEDRQTMLRERARKLIADARAGIVSPTSPNRMKSPTVEIISRKTVMDEIVAAGGADNIDALLSRASTPPSRTSLSPDRSEGRHSSESKSVKSTNSVESQESPLMSFNNLVERITPDDNETNDQGTETGTYIQSELEALEREQVAVDIKAAALEKKLRDVMDNNDNTEEEDRLMSQWFNLVNKKNALIRRQMQLNILEQEEDLSRRCSLLARELRLSLSVEEWRKTSGQKRRERLLLQELLEAVNRRDRLVQEMDEQERAIADDDEIERNLSQVEIQRKNNCRIQ